MSTKLVRQMMTLVAAAMSLGSVSAEVGYRDGGQDSFAELPAAPVVSGDRIDVTAANAQYVLDGAYGSIDNKTINFTESIPTALVLGRPTKYAGSGTIYRIGSFDGGTVSLDELPATGVCYYTRTLQNVTFTAAGGVELAGLTAHGGAHVYGTTDAPVYDYVRDTGDWCYSTPNSYYMALTLENIAFRGVSFTKQVKLDTSSELSHYDGVTFEKCTFTTGGTASQNGAAIHFCSWVQPPAVGDIRNLVVNGCTFNNCYQGVYTSSAVGVTVRKSTFDRLGHNAVAIQNGVKDGFNHGQVVITGNTMKNLADRAIRFGYVGAGTSIMICGNEAVYTGQGQDQCIKAESIAEGVTTEVKFNTWDNYAAAANAVLTEAAVVAKIGDKEYTSFVAAVEAAQEGDSITVVNFDKSVMKPPVGYGFGTFDGVTKLYPQSVAQVGTTQYSDLAEALAAAAEKGSTCELLCDFWLRGEWKPIDTFSGTLDGEGHTIYGLTVSSGGSEYTGLIGLLSGGVVRNVNFAAVAITTTSNDVGAAVGRIVEGGTVSGVNVLSGALTGGKRVGGVVGSVKADGTIGRCSNAAAVTANTYNAGGIVGAAYYTEAGREMYVTNCTNTGAVRSDDVCAGGIVGLSAANVLDNSNSGTVTGSGTSIGGIVGEQKTYGRVCRNTNSGAVENKAKAYGTGGIVGWLRYVTGEDPAYAQSAVIEVSGNTNGANIAGGNDAGGIVGTLYNSAVVSGNVNTAGTLAGGTFAAGIVGNYQATETPAAVPKDSLVFVDNTSTTALDNIAGGCRDLLIYTNGNKVIRPVAQVGDVYYETFEGALEAANAADVGPVVVTLLADVAYAENGTGLWNVTHSMTIDGNGHTMSGWGSRGGNKTTLAINNGGTSSVDVKLINLTINNAGDKGRPIETRGNIRSLTIENCTINATGNGNNQGITIGGSQASKAVVALKDTTVSAGTAGYPYVSFNPAEVTIQGGALSGFCGMFFKGESSSSGSRGTTVAASGTRFDCPNCYSGVSNDFGVFVLEDDGISISLTDCYINSEVKGDARQAVLSLSEYAGRRSEPCALTIRGDETVVVGTMMDNEWGSSFDEGVLQVYGGSYSSDISAYIPVGEGLGFVYDEELKRYTVCPLTNWIQIADTRWYEGNEGNDTFFLETPEELAGLARLVNAGNSFAGKTVAIEKDFDLGCYDTDTRTVQWTPIGSSTSTPFAGSFIAYNGAAIRNLTIDEPTKDCQGLFGVVNNVAGQKAPSFTYVALENVKVTGHGRVAGLIAQGQTVASIEECSVRGLIQLEAASDGEYAAPVFAHGYVLSISGCSVTGAAGSYVKAKSQTGGIAGFTGEMNKAFQTKIENCRVEGIGLTAAERTGAIVATLHRGGVVQGCSAKNVTMASDSAGDNGLVVGRTIGELVNGSPVPTYVINNTVENVTGTEANGVAVTRIHGFRNDTNRPYAVAGAGVVLDENNLVVSADKLVYGYTEGGASYLAEGSTATAHPDNDGTWRVVGKAVAQIGNVRYSTLQAAVDAAVGGDTIVLVDDVTLDAGKPVCVTNKEGTVTLDLNGRTLTGSNTNSYISYPGTLPGTLFVSGADLTVVDSAGGGLITNEFDGLRTSMTVVAAALEGTARATQVTLGKNVKVGLKCGSAIWSTTSGNSTQTAKVTVEAGAAIDAAGFFRVDGAGELEVKGGSFKASDALPFNVNAPAVRLGGGVYDVKEQRSFGAAILPCVTTKGMLCERTEYGYRVTLTDDEPDSDICLELSDGKRIYGDAAAIDYYISKAAKIIVNRCTTLERSAGFGSTSEDKIPSLEIEIAEGAVLSGSFPLYVADVTVTGGGSVSDGFFKAKDEKYMLVDNGGGSYSCRIDDTADYPAQVVKADGTVVKCASLEAAVSAAQGLGEGAYAQMRKDITIDAGFSTSGFKFAGGKVTIDMNGFDLAITSPWFKTGAFLGVSENQTLTLLNGAADQKESAVTGEYTDCSLKVSGTVCTIGKGVKVSGYGVALAGSGSELTVEGSVENTNGGSAIAYYAGASNAAVTVKDGSAVSAIGNAPAINAKGMSVTIEGGRIASAAGDGVQIDSGSLKVSGGTIQGAAHAVYIIGSVDSIGISGGAFKGKIACESQENFISGGVFSEKPEPEDPKAKYVASGHVVLGNTAANRAEYPWTVGIEAPEDTIVVHGQGREVSADAKGEFEEVAVLSPKYEVVKKGTDDRVTVDEADDRSLDFATLPTGVYTLRAKVTENDTTKTVKILDVGVIQVAAQKTTILAVPFTGVDGKKVTVATLFDAAAAGLQSGDTMSLYDAEKGKYASFSWEDGAWTSADDGNYDSALTLEPGSAALLKSKNASAKVTLVGTPAEEVSATVKTATVGMAVNMTTAEKKVSDLTVGDTGKGVYVYTPAETATGNVQYAWNGSKWVKHGIKTITVGGKEYTVQGDVDVTETDVVPAGTGYWVRNTTTGDIEVK